MWAAFCSSLAFLVGWLLIVSWLTIGGVLSREAHWFWWSQWVLSSIASEGGGFQLTPHFLPSFTISTTRFISQSFILNRLGSREKVARSRLFWLLGLFSSSGGAGSLFESSNFNTIYRWNRKKLSHRDDRRIKIGILNAFLAGLCLSDSYNCTTAIRDSAVSTVHPRSSVFLGRRGSLINEWYWIQPARITGRNRCGNLVKIYANRKWDRAVDSFWLTGFGWGRGFFYSRSR